MTGGQRAELERPARSTLGPLREVCQAGGLCGRRGRNCWGGAGLELRARGPSVRPARVSKPYAYHLGSYRIATAPELNSSRPTSVKSTYFDSPANKVGPWPASLGCTTNS